MRWLLLAALLLAAPFFLSPELDLEIARHFASGTDGFPHRYHPLAMTVYVGVRVMTTLLSVGYILLLLWRVLRKDALLPLLRCAAPGRRTLLFLLLAMVLGPGIVVHWVFKETVDRPRPRQVVEFGGTEPYQPPPFVPQQGPAAREGKSFPSGHTAMGFYLCAFALLARTRGRRAGLYLLGIGAGLLIGYVRMLQGGHFLSDVLGSAMVVLLTNHLLYWWMFRPTRRESTSPARP